MKPSHKAHLVMACQTLLIGPAYTFVSWTTAEVEPFTLLWFRLLGSALIFSLVFWVRGGWKGRVRPERRDWRGILLLSLVGILLNQFFFVSGLTYTLPALSALIYALTPMAVLLATVFLFRTEKITALKLVGIIIALTGVVIVILVSKNIGVTGKHNLLLGNLLTILAVICWSVYLVKSRSYMQRFDSVQLTGVLMVISMLVYLPVGAVLLPSFQFSAISPAGWFGFAYLVLISSVASYFMIMYSVARLSSSQVAIYMNAQPIAATLFSVLYAGQSLSWPVIGGGALTLSGIFLLNRGEHLMRWAKNRKGAQPNA